MSVDGSLFVISAPKEGVLICENSMPESGICEHSRAGVAGGLSVRWPGIVRTNEDQLPLPSHLLHTPDGLR